MKSAQMYANTMDRGRKLKRPATAKKSKFISRDKNHQNWTNVFSRKTQLWDHDMDCLEPEKQQIVKEIIMRLKLGNNDRCCGNSPGKTNYPESPIRELT